MLSPPRLIEEGHANRAGAIAHLGRHHRAFAFEPAKIDPTYRAEHHPLFTFTKIANGRFLGPVDVATRVVTQQVEHAVDVGLAQRFGTLRSNTLDRFDAERVEITKRQRRFR